MALIVCPDCGREVSDRAAACPQCGGPIVEAVATPTPMVLAHGSSGGNVLAALLSLFVPGLGQLVQGRFYAAAIWMIAELTVAGVAFVGLLAARGGGSVASLGVVLVASVAVHLWQVYDAATYRPPEA